MAVMVHDRAQDQATVRAAGAATALTRTTSGSMPSACAARRARASRARIVEAADAERRRLERDLHDGAQSRLVALALSLRLARMSTPDGHRHGRRCSTPRSTSSGRAWRNCATSPAASIRRCSPSAGSSRPSGHSPRARRSRWTWSEGRPASSRGGRDGRVLRGLGALTNVSKYAHAGHATVRVERVDGRLLVNISDDGVGGASTDHGSGLRGLSDRVAALSGTLEISESPVTGPACAPNCPAHERTAHTPLRVVVAEDSFLPAPASYGSSRARASPSWGRRATPRSSSSRSTSIGPTSP